MKRQPKGKSSGGQFVSSDSNRERAGQVEAENDSVNVSRGKDEEWRNSKDQLHRLDGPAIRRFSLSGEIVREEWYKEGRLHRLDGPASIVFGGVANGGEESWYREGELYRIGGPAVRRFSNGVNGGEEAWGDEEGRLHRIGGPAVQLRGGVSNGGTEQYWLHGVHFESRTDYDEALRYLLAGDPDAQ